MLHTGLISLELLIVMSRYQILALYAVFAIGYTLSTIITPYPGDFALKALPILLMLFWVWKQDSFTGKKWLSAALLFSVSGDILLAMEFQQHFIAGLSAFLLAHLCYTCFLFPYFNTTHGHSKSLAVVLVSVYCLILVNSLTIEDTFLQMAVWIYVTVITAMCGFAIFSSQGKYHLQVAGALIFAASDSIIALDTFRTAIPHSALMIMSTYYLAQILIVAGLLGLGQRHASSSNG